MKYKWILSKWDTSAHIDAEVTLVNRRSNEEGTVVSWDVEVNGEPQTMILDKPLYNRKYHLRIGKLSGNGYKTETGISKVQMNEKIVAAWNERNGRKAVRNQ